MRLLLVAALACVGCSTSLGDVALLGRTTNGVGVKLLRPDAVGRACRTSWFGILGRSGDPTIAEATADIFELDAEGDVLTDATVRRTALITGIYNRRCVEVEASLGRVIPTIQIPAAAGHHGHH